MAGSFKDFSMAQELYIATLEAGYNEPTPIQEQVIPAVLEGRDVLGAAPTGTGKSAAYLLPILNKVIINGSQQNNKRVTALILVPTKELAVQTRNFLLEFAARLTVRTTLAFGGVGISPQIQEIRRGTDIVVATPGRALELVERKELALDTISFCVLDEVDRMLQMGFLHDIDAVTRKIGGSCQIMMFSATITADTARLGGRLLQNPLTIDIQQKETSFKTVESVKCHTLFVEKDRKRKLLLWVLKEIKFTKALIFVNSKSDADRLGRDLTKAEINHVVLHGDRNNTERQRAAEQFQRGSVPVMVATDLTARGFDVPNLTLVINYDMPTSTEVFVHRAGRTGRAGTLGQAFSFCDQNSKHFLQRIEETLEVVPEHFPWQPFHSDKIEEMDPQESLDRMKAVRERETDRREASEERKVQAEAEKPRPAVKKVPRKERVVPTKTGSKVEGRRAKVTGKGKQKSNRPDSKVQKSRGKRH